MKVKNVVFSIFMMLLPCVVLAEKCDQGAGWYYNSSIQECQKCDTGNYCNDGETATECPKGYTSAEGAKSAEECYKECTAKNGDVGSGTQHYAGDGKTAKCVISAESCTSGYTYVKNAPTDKTNEFDGYCLETEKDCSKLLNAKCTVYKNGCEETDSNVSQGDVTGKAKITDTTNGTYNLTTACKCKVASRHTNGTHYIDYYSYSSSCFVSNSRSSEVTKCDAGYCKQSSSILACQQTPAGYYHADDGGKDCKPCPAGQTSNVGSSSQSDCHYTSETQFCDDNGCISFPMM